MAPGQQCGQGEKAAEIVQVKDPTLRPGGEGRQSMTGGKP
jgi:hypothetical protein